MSKAWEYCNNFFYVDLYNNNEEDEDNYRKILK